MNRNFIEWKLTYKQPLVTEQYILKIKIAAQYRFNENTTKTISFRTSEKYILKQSIIS